MYVYMKPKACVPFLNPTRRDIHSETVPSILPFDSICTGTQTFENITHSEKVLSAVPFHSACTRACHAMGKDFFSRVTLWEKIFSQSTLCSAFP